MANPLNAPHHSGSGIKVPVWLVLAVAVVIGLLVWAVTAKPASTSTTTADSVSTPAASPVPAHLDLVSDETRALILNDYKQERWDTRWNPVSWENLLVYWVDAAHTKAWVEGEFLVYPGNKQKHMKMLANVDGQTVIFGGSEK